MSPSSSKKCPAVSIISAVLNAKNDLLDTIESIKAQDYSDLEYIVVDGLSQDGTQEVLQENRDIVTRWVSEKDSGISDAFNKGVKMASGDYVIFLGAGDTFDSKDTILEMMKGVDVTQDLLICGKVRCLSESGEILKIAPKQMHNPFKKSSLIYKLTLPHQGLFMHKNYFKKFGFFNEKNRFAMDYELILRSFHDFPVIQLKDRVVANWRAGGIGKDRTLEIYDEYHWIKKHHQIAPLYWLVLVDQWNRLKWRAKSRFHF